MRKLVRIVNVGKIQPVKGADRIELTHIGGWPVCVKKGQFQEGDRAVYFEIDSFLPKGNPHWDFLMPDNTTVFEGVAGRRLRTLQQCGQLSQGLLLPITILGEVLRGMPVGTDVTAALGVFKYEKPLTQQQMAVSDGYRPGVIPSTDLERVQNLEEQGTLADYCLSDDAYQVTEKLEGCATHFAMLNNALRVYGTKLSYKELPGSPEWVEAKKLQLAEKLLPYGGIVLQGEMVGPGFEGNIYELKEPQFWLYRVLLLDEGRFMVPSERATFASELGLRHVPILREDFYLAPGVRAAQLLALADGPSVLNPKKRREGIVFENRTKNHSFKVISDAYLLNAKMKPEEMAGFMPAAVEQLGVMCKDSGKCHHHCETECFRKGHCSPLSISGLTYEQFKA